MINEEEEEDEGILGHPDEFKRDDSKFEWSSRAKILKETLDELVRALRSVDMKYQQLQTWDG